MIIKEDIHFEPACQANFPEFVIAKGKVPKQSLYSRGQENIKAMREGSRRNNIKDHGLTSVV
jgi:hypothetical protein